MNLIEQIKAAQGSRGRLETIFLKLAASADAAPAADVDAKCAAKEALAPLAHALLACGAFAQVLDLAEFAASYGPIEPALSAFAGTAAANLGLAQQAIERLRSAAAALDIDSPTALAEEVYGTLGRLYKQRALECEGAQRAHDFELSLKAYREAYRISEGIWSGVNVATLSLLLERKFEAQSLARTLSAQIDTQLVPVNETLVEKQWRHAVRGETALLQNDLGTAAEHYAIAASIAQDAFRFGEATSMRRQARLILQAQRRSPDLADLWMPTPIVVTFTGHRFDQDTKEPRFPISSLALVRQRLQERLSNRQIRIAFCSLSEGADILFAQAALAAGLELNIVLPNDRTALKIAWQDQTWQDQGLQDRGLGSYAEVIEPILASASKVYELTPEGPTGTAIDYLYANEILLGSAILRTQECEGNLRGLAIWDRLPARGMGGTATMVAEMLALGLAVDIIDPLNASLRQMQGTPTQRDRARAEIAPCGHKMRALLFGDFVGFSKLSTLDTIEFAERVLPALARVIDDFEASGKPIAVRNTWGDGLFLVLEDALDVALLALEIQACVSALAPNLSFPLKMRVALHYAPVLLMTDAISRRANAVGPGVSRAARLEPATAPGSVYASEALATQLALSRYPNTPRYSFLKHLPWAKGYGVYPTYLIENHPV